MARPRCLPEPESLSDAPVGRLPVAVERTAYAVVREAVEQAARAGLVELSVGFRRDDDRLFVTINGVRGVDHPHQADRAGPVGGRLQTDGGVLEAEIPCGSS